MGEGFNYEKEVETVFDNAKLKVIGFRVRMHVLAGSSQDIPDVWAASKSLLKPEWKMGIATRKLARDYLLTLDALEPVLDSQKEELVGRIPFIDKGFVKWDSRAVGFIGSRALIKVRDIVAVEFTDCTLIGGDSCFLEFDIKHVNEKMASPSVYINKEVDSDGFYTYVTSQFNLFIDELFKEIEEIK